MAPPSWARRASARVRPVALGPMTSQDERAESIGASYASAGVDIEAGDRAVELFKPHAKKATRPEVRGGLGGFAGLFGLKAGYREPLLASSTDGVGTKLAVAQAMDKHDTVGIDLVAMVVDDLVVCGAEPLFLQDYIAVGRTVPERVAEIVSGIAEGCVQAGCALLGGETAEHPGLMEPDHYDISATGVGVVEADDLLGPENVRPGDVIIAMAATGLHSNGYSLARKVLLEIDRMSLSGHVEEFGRTLGEELLEPTRIYAKDCLALAAETQVRTFCHVTGGGLAGNLERVIKGRLVLRTMATRTPQIEGPHLIRDDDLPWLRVTSDTPIACQIDGDFVGLRESMTFTSVPAALNVVAPPAKPQ